MREGEHNRTLDYTEGRYSKMAFKILHHPVYYMTHLVLSILLVLLALVETPGDGHLSPQLASLQNYVSTGNIIKKQQLSYVK